MGTDEAAVRVLGGARVDLAGSRDRDELVRFYAEADVFVLPSRSGREALARGRAPAHTGGVGGRCGAPGLQ